VANPLAFSGAESHFSEDNPPMTFQICMATAEGVMLASDRKLTNLNEVRFGRLIPKIEVYEKENFAHCSAGDDFCEIFTETIREELARVLPISPEARGRKLGKRCGIASIRHETKRKTLDGVWQDMEKPSLSGLVDALCSSFGEMGRLNYGPSIPWGKNPPFNP
jgi:hypothetical protein